MSNQVPPGSGQPPYPGSEPPYEPYSSQAPGVPQPGPPGSFPQGAQPYGQTSYGSEPSYGPGQYGPGQQPYGQPSDPSYGPPAGGQQPSFGPGPGQEQPSYGYDPAQPGYAAVPGYQAQPGQGQYPSQGGYVPSYAGGPQPGAPKGGSGGKIVAIVAAAVVVVGLVVGGVVLLTRDDGGDPAASPSASAKRTGSSAKPSSSATPRPEQSSSMSYDDAQALAEAAFPAAAGHSYDFCADGHAEYDSAATMDCFNDVDDYVHVYVWDDPATALQSIRGHYIDFAESSWAGGTEFRYDADGYYYQVVRCYADSPVCFGVFEDTKDEAEAVLGHFSYLDGAGIAALNDKLADAGL